MEYVKKIKGERVFLSPTLLEDYEIYTKWLNDVEVARGINMYSQNLSYEKEKEYLENYVINGYNFAIVKNDKTLLGNISLSDVSLIDGIATLGIFIGDSDNRSQGYGSEAINLLVEYGFNHLNLKNIMLKVYEFNIGAIKCYKKCGFKEFGRRSKCHYFNGTYYDEIFMEKIK